MTIRVWDDVADTLETSRADLVEAACHDLGLPRAFVEDQLAYLLDVLSARRECGADGPGAQVAFLMPSNSEGALAIYLVTLAASLGLTVHLKLSSRQPRIEDVLRAVLAPLPAVTFHPGTGKAFLHSMIADENVAFVQAFGDDSWINPYRDIAAATGTTLAFEGPGKDPLIVLPGADVERAIDDATVSGLFAGGAACMSTERYLVHEGLAEAFVAGLVDRLKGVEPTTPTDPAAVLGLQYSAAAVERLNEQIEEALTRGADAPLLGGIAPVTFGDRTMFACRPTVLVDVPTCARVWREESFGPVFPVVAFRTREEAVHLAEDSAYGLTATVLGPAATARSVADQLRTSHGVVFANTTMMDGFKPEYWGSGGYKRSGWLDETVNGHRACRAGFRPLAAELQRLIPGGTTA